MDSNQEPPPPAVQCTCTVVSFLQSWEVPLDSGNGEKCKPTGADAATAVTASSMEDPVCFVMAQCRQDRMLAAARLRLLLPKKEMFSTEGGGMLREQDGLGSLGTV